MVPTIIKRGVRSLENNQAVIDREAWFKARLLLSRLMAYLLLMGWEHVPVWMLRASCSHLWRAFCLLMSRFHLATTDRRWPSPSAVRPGAGW